MTKNLAPWQTLPFRCAKNIDYNGCNINSRFWRFSHHCACRCPGTWRYQAISRHRANISANVKRHHSKWPPRSRATSRVKSALTYHSPWRWIYDGPQSGWCSFRTGFVSSSEWVNQSQGRPPLWLRLAPGSWSFVEGPSRDTPVGADPHWGRDRPIVIYITSMAWRKHCGNHSALAFHIYPSIAIWDTRSFENKSTNIFKIAFETVISPDLLTIIHKLLFVVE